MKILWAPWRMVYIEGGKTEDCIFCVARPKEEWQAHLVLQHTVHSLVMLNKFPYNNGHLLVAPKRHAAFLQELPPEEFGDLMETVRRSLNVVFSALHPQGVNVGMNVGRCAGAGVEDHLHWHVVPRWQGDTNFMPVVGEVKVMPLHLQASYERLKPFFLSL